MAVTGGFFNSISGDRKYNAEQIGNYFEGLVSNGVFENVGNKLIVKAKNGLDITIGTGRAMINCHWMKNDTELTLTLDSADVQYDRIDVVVVKLDLSNGSRTVSIEIKKGTPSSNPQRPGLTRNDNIYEIGLAKIKIPANAVSITQSNITDLRGNTKLCGYVTGLIKQVDTNDLFLQYQTALEEYYENATAQLDAIIAQKTAAFDAWFRDLTDELRVDTTLTTHSTRVVITGAPTWGIYMIDDWFDSNDILFVYINGILLDNTEYSVNGRNIDFVNPVEPGNVIFVKAIKNAIGSSNLSNDVISVTPSFNIGNMTTTETISYEEES